MQVTRQKILAYLKTHPGSSAAEISRFLEMTPANIRYHLEILGNKGTIQITGQRPVIGSGRPIFLYNLSSRALGENIIPLLRGILDVITDHEDRDLLIQEIASQLANHKQELSKNRITRFNEAVVHLNENNYHASWRATPDGPQVELKHCPYQNLAQTHPHLCQLDEQILSALFQTPLGLIHKRTFENNPFSPCIFKPTDQH